MVWYIHIYNIDCPYKIGDSETCLEPERSNKVKCNYPNKVYRPKRCIEESCPIRETMHYTD